MADLRQEAPGPRSRSRQLATSACGCDRRPPAAATIPAADQGAGGHLLRHRRSRCSPSDTDGAQDVYRRANGVLTLETLGDLGCQPGCGNGPDDVEVPGRGIPILEPEGVDLLHRRVAGRRRHRQLDRHLRARRRDDHPGLGRAERVQRRLTTPSCSSGAPTAPRSSSRPGSSWSARHRQRQRTSTNGRTGRRHSSRRGRKSSTANSTRFRRRASDDASVVFFTSAEQLVAADTDSSVDLYRREGGVDGRCSRGDRSGPPRVLQRPLRRRRLRRHLRRRLARDVLHRRAAHRNDEDTAQGRLHPLRRNDDPGLARERSTTATKEFLRPTSTPPTRTSTSRSSRRREKLERSRQGQIDRYLPAPGGGVTELASQGPPGTFPGIYNGPSTADLPPLPAGGQRRLLHRPTEKLVATRHRQLPRHLRAHRRRRP